MIRRSHAGEAEAHFRVQHDACVAAFAHVFPPHPLDVGYTFRGESPAP